MPELFRNLARRKLRNGLTLAGIVIGVLALTTMGAMAERANAAIDGGVRYFGDHVTVTSDVNGPLGQIVPVDRSALIARVPGVNAACATVSTSAKSDLDFSVSLGPGDIVTAQQPGCRAYARYSPPIAAGRLIDEQGQGEVVLGHDIAKEFGWRLGDDVVLPRPPRRPSPDYVPHTFHVVGVYARTQTAPDSFAVVSFADGQKVFGDSLPPTLRRQVDPTQLAGAVAAYGERSASVAELDRLAGRISEAVAGVRAIPPSQLVTAFRNASYILTGITTGAALLALVIGGLSVVNTMLMAVTERIREIGLKKAVGARTGDIAREFLIESTLFGAAGGAAGLLIGWAATALLNAYLASTNQSELFLVSGRLVALAVIFSVGLGALAGVIPALRAARLDPVQALRAQ